MSMPIITLALILIMLIFLLWSYYRSRRPCTNWPNYLKPSTLQHHVRGVSGFTDALNRSGRSGSWLWLPCIDPERVIKKLDVEFGPFVEVLVVWILRSALFDDWRFRGSGCRTDFAYWILGFRGVSEISAYYVRKECRWGFQAKTAELCRHGSRSRDGIDHLFCILLSPQVLFARASWRRCWPSRPQFQIATMSYSEIQGCCDLTQGLNNYLYHFFGGFLIIAIYSKICPQPYSKY